MSDYVDNILAVYRRATPADMREGKAWYRKANRLARELCPSDVWRAAGVIAALSPLKEWKLNERYARNAFATGVASGNMPMHNAIAQRILDGEPPLSVMRGDKTRNFTMAIATGGKSDVATIDRHAYDIALAQVHTDKTRKIGKRVYRDMAAAYSEAAAQCGVSVNQMQAITWVVWKREKGHK